MANMLSLSVVIPAEQNSHIPLGVDGSGMSGVVVVGGVVVGGAIGIVVVEVVNMFES
jgi:hypothetical protein